MTSPCYGCGKRHSGCHGSCAAYISWSTTREARRKELRMASDADGFAIDSHRKIKKRYNKSDKR